MKTLLFALLFITTLSFGQAPKKANVILIGKDGASESVLKDFAVYMQDKGFNVLSMDKELLTLSTDYKEMKWAGLARIKYMARVKNVDGLSVIELRSQVKVSNGFAEGEFDACNCGGMDNAKIHAFKDMDQLAKDFGGQISYSVK